MYHSLSKQELVRKLPALYTMEGHQKTSDKYQPISTAMILETLEDEGFYPTYAIQAKTRCEEKKAYSKHLIRFRRASDLSRFDNVAPEIVLVNSHDGLSSYRLYSGLVRFACLNGLIAGNQYDEIRIRHQGNILDNVIEGTHKLANNFSQVLESVEKMSQIYLDHERQLELATIAHRLRFEDEPNRVFEHSALLRARRSSDKGHDLFSVFNVIQENIIRGGVAGYSTNNRGYFQRTRSREIKSIDLSLNLNRNLWSAAENLMLHAA